jgi:hypothetical protein
MDSDDYAKDFLPCYKAQQKRRDWSFKAEMKLYCEADVVLLAKTVLEFRELFKKSLDVDPFRYVTLASLCMDIYINKFLPEKTIVGNNSEKQISKVCKEWLNYLNDREAIPEVPLSVYKRDATAYKYYRRDRHVFTVDALNRSKKLCYEFYGCYWHVCPECYPKCKA